MTPQDEEGWERLHHDSRPPRALRALGCVLIGLLAYPVVAAMWLGAVTATCHLSSIACVVAYWGWLVCPVVIAVGISIWAYRRTS